MFLRGVFMNALTDYLSTYFDEIEPKDFYREIFPKGELDTKDSKTKGKYTGIIVEVTKEKKGDGKHKVLRHTLTDDLDKIDEVLSTDNFCLMSPISYSGKKRLAKNARFAYAMTFDLDHIIHTKDGKPQGLIDLINGHIKRAERLPNPTFIVSSGTGLHLYYVFEKPIPLFDNIARQLQVYKHEMTELMWNEGIVNIKSHLDIQQEGIYQGFRLPGTITKLGDRAKAFITGEKVTMEYMNEFVRDKYKVTDYTYKSNLTLAQAKEKYPEWYEQRIVKGDKTKKSWNLSRNVYDWWKREILTKGKVGHRYYCLMTLVIYAKKCSSYDPKFNPNPVTYEELEADAFEIMEYFETLTDSDENHFTEQDVMDALESFHDRFITYPREAIEYRTGIVLPKNKRNFRGQEQHIKIMNAVREVTHPNGAWRNADGRPKGSMNKEHPKEKLVKDYIKDHPTESPTQIAKALGISRPTVYKYMK